MSEHVKSIKFAFLVAFICSVLLTLAATGLKPFQLQNIALDKQKNILKALGLLSEDLKYSKTDIEQLYNANIELKWVTPEGAIVTEQNNANYLPIYLYVKNNKIEGYVLPIDTKGLWGKILGYLALQSDGSTISGFSVYSHAETPGLGGEIERSWFRKNFAGKRITDQSGEFVSIAIAKGHVKDTIQPNRQMNYVDGISGATLTGKYLSQGLKDILKNYETLSIKFRMNRIGNTK